MTEAESDRMFDDKLAGALARAGLNTLLLDIRESQARVEGKVDAMTDRIKIIEPTLWELESERLRRQGLRQGLARYFRWAHALWIALGAAAAWAAQHLPGWPWIGK